MAKRSKTYIRLPGRQRRWVSIVLAGYIVLLLNSLLLVLFDNSTASAYMSTVLLHVALGTLLVLPVLVFLVMHLGKMPLRMNRAATVAGLTTALSLGTLLATGFAIVAYGAAYDGGWILTLHVASAVVTVLAFVGHVSLKRGVRYHFLEWGTLWKEGPKAALRHPFGVTLVVGVAVSLLVLAPALRTADGVFIEQNDENPLAAAQAVLAEGHYLDAHDLSRSESCGQAGCHPDVTAQWAESAHRFSSFNNPYYKKTIELMVARSGVEPTRWCASCHDPVVLFSGGFGNERELDVDDWTAHEGITCLSCHATRGLRDLRGNGRYVMDKPDEYPFARTKADPGRWIHNTLVRIKPEPHREAMMQPVLRTQEFCGSCHKVGIPQEVNNYRWKRGQNEWDAWQASGTSGNTVRSFYVPDRAQNCVTCHMPLVPSDDRGGSEGKILSHRFASANTALPHLNGHPDQLDAVQRALEDSIVTVDLFRVSVDGRTYGPDEVMPVLRPGDELAVEVVVRNRKVGHMLPGGTNDSNEMWLQLLAESQEGETVLASGMLDEEGRVDTTAHFWGAVLVDRSSRVIDKRNVQDWIATVYAHTIGPGTANTVHYRFTVPEGAPVTGLRAELQHRKFRWSYNDWVFRGHPVPGQPDSLATAAVDHRAWTLDDRSAPNLPVTTMAAAARRTGEVPAAARPLWERWNDYGIGLLLEGDTRGALEAFGRVAELVPESPEGPINRARVFLEEGQLDRAIEALDEAEQRRPGYLKTAYFRGVYLRSLGRYGEALDEWMRVYEKYPRDRVLVQGIGRVHYLDGRYEEALGWFDQVLEIDPEFLGGLYNRMLTLGAMGRQEAFAEAQQRYAFHKDDEDAMAVTAAYKQKHAMDNREAQRIHEHGLHPPGDFTPKPMVAGQVLPTPVRSATHSSSDQR